MQSPKLKNIDWLAGKIIKILVPVILFLPLLVSSSHYCPYIFPRNIVFRLFMSVIFALFLFLLIRGRNFYRPNINKVVAAYLGLAFILTVSSVINGDFLTSFWSNAQRMDGLINLYYLSAFLLVLLGVYGQGRDEWMSLLVVTGFVSFMIAFLGLGQGYTITFFLPSTGGDRITSTIGNPAFLASYSLFHIFFAAYLLFKDKRRTLKFELIAFYVLDAVIIAQEIMAHQHQAYGVLTMIFRNWITALFFLAPQIFVHVNVYFSKSKTRMPVLSGRAYFAALAVLNFTVLFKTGTRSALLGLLAGLLAMSVFMIVSKASRKIRFGSAAVIALVIIMGFSVFVFRDTTLVQNSNVLRRITHISGSDFAASSRLWTWQAGLKGWKDKPLLGWGEERFNIAFNKHFPAEIVRDDPGMQVWFDRPHNVFVEALVKGGILGLVTFLAIFWFVFLQLYRYYKSADDLKAVIILGGLTVAYLVNNFFVFDSFNTNILFILLLVAVSRVAAMPADETAQPKQGRPWLAAACVLFVIFLGYTLNAPPNRGNKEFMRTFQAFSAMIRTGYDESIDNKLIAVTNRNYLGKFEYRQLYSEVVRSIEDTSVIGSAHYKAMLDRAEAQLLKSIDEQPDNARNYIFLVNFYLSAGTKDPSYYDKNIVLIKKAIPLSPTMSQFYYSLGRSYEAIKDFNSAIEAFEKGREINPRYFQSYTNLIKVYLQTGDRIHVRQTLERLQQNIRLRPYHFIRVSEIYSSFNSYKEAGNYIDAGLLKYPGEPRLLQAKDKLNANKRS